MLCQMIWCKFGSSFVQEIEKISIPRWIRYEDEVDVRELHGFCVASEKGYAAVIYTRFVDAKQHARVNLLISKTRVSPIKPVSLPRLELNGATLLAKLMKKVQESMFIEWTYMRGATIKRRFYRFMANHNAGRRTLPIES